MSNAVLILLSILIPQLIAVKPSKEIDCCATTKFDICAKTCYKLRHSGHLENKLHHIRRICPYSDLIAVKPSKEIDCCATTKFDICAKTCYKLRHSGHLENKLHHIRRICPYSDERFWHCIRQNLNASKVLHSHGHCCLFAKTSACAVECFHSRALNQVHKRCSSNEETPVRRCLNKYRIERRCCGKGKTRNCKISCRKFISSGIHNNSATTMLHHICSTSPSVLDCLRVTGYKINPANPYLTCCKYGKTIQCQQQCEKSFSTRAREKDIVYKLNFFCGPMNPQDDLYRCILGTLSNPGSNLLQGHCCTVAFSQTCKRWCYQTFSKRSSISFYDPLYVQCMENPKEYELSTCISDVLEPCKFGCSDALKFCSNFNHRPLELFRRCDAHADTMAEKLFKSWERGDFSSLTAKASIQNISLCEPNVWKALACTLVIKPCSRKSNRNQLCRSDCVSLLEKCLIADHKDVAKTAEKICIALMPNPDQTDCVTSLNYVKPAKRNMQPLGMFPCQNDPCKTNHVCTINKDCSLTRPSQNCRPFSCIPGCSLGASSTIKVRNLSLFKIIFTSNDEICNKVCQCTTNDKGPLRHNGLSCTNTTCYKNLPCTVNGKLKEHKSRFRVDNTLCTCFGGELICTKNANIQQSNRQKEQPCNCNMDIFNPVCGANGITFPSICLARCSGLKDALISPGSCSTKDSCNPSPCPRSLVCMPHRRVCLHQSLLCPQYDCVEPKLTLKMIAPCILDDEKTKECEKDPFGTQCCKGNCHEKFSKAPVCGLDGVTYSSSCAATNHLIPVDYEGSCTGNESLPALKSRCSMASCKKVVKCNFHVPIGGCCPICEPFLRILYSRSEAASHIEKVSPKPIAVRDFIEQLSYYIHVSQCAVRGYMTIEGDIIVIIRSTLPHRNSLQDEICGRETERISSLINMRSPIVTTNYYLSIAKAAFIQHPKMSQQNRSSLTSVDLFIIVLISFATFISV